ncbi:chaperone, ATP12 [Roseomonas sp. NAR14]|uniref:Chaperone, ATP12 n=1 Tax=Roseomonas acroporae TaxID=2937791 RepID=A0A9X1YF57_9PROT|nr:ATP12 family protein [Roseomonas acroporae]MCK8787532.1 chaperone, ATP12 [Roseomonas acroporae]
MKRFWTGAEAAPCDGGFRVLLDGRPMRLPGGAPLLVADRMLALALAEEWQAAGGGKGGEMSFEDVPLTRLVGTAQDRIAPDPAPTVAALARYGASDLLCYRSDDPELAARQAAAWQPLLDWASLHHGAPLLVTTGIMPVAQPPESLAALHRAVAALPPVALAALGVAVPALGSLVLGLALQAGRLDDVAAHALASMDETYQEERWGVDEPAAAARAKRGEDVALAARLLRLA